MSYDLEDYEQWLRDCEEQEYREWCYEQQQAQYFREMSLTWYDRKLLPLEYVEGEWLSGAKVDNGDVGAVVSYAFEPSPETGHVGWIWWALGSMGDAGSMRQAMRDAEAALKRKAGLCD
jgi:hypothetical protein